MRLIDVNTFELKEFFSEKAPPYAILSHTWKGDTEVTFQEWECAAVDDAVKQKEGYAKIMGACCRARADDLQYLWCDTNCIDKSSSAELSEAINSMFTWYRDSTVCYTYLYDVQAETDTFTKSRWFTRGWTLQELLAPSKVLFFDRHWTVLGDRSELAGVVSDITRIHIGALRDRSTIYDYSIAQRMSWAANRQTSRQEDIAYCLLGIFNINMPLLYGEGQNAFSRLQREIVEVSNDHSILAWDWWHSDTRPPLSALAPSPAEFRFCGSIVQNHKYDRNPYSITNLGISMNLTLIKMRVKGMVLVGLNCEKVLCREAHHSRLPDGIKLERHFRIWIPLRHSRYNTFFRAHYPSSKIFLQQLYQVMEHPTPTDLFLSLDSSQAGVTQPLEDIDKFLRQYPSNLSSGSLVSVASGAMTSQKQIIREVYPLDNISITQLKCRGTSSVSHQFISSGNFSVIFSVYWNEQGFPQEWLYTNLYNPKLKTSTHISSDGDWSCLFGGDAQFRSAQDCNSVASMHSLHRKLREQYERSLDGYVRTEEDPIVNVEDKPLEDLFGQQELIVDIIFRESPRSQRLLTKG
ncbi:HET-domain-containing protein [Daldinia loculata]|uniref:HET-domain-containing protein n=1 Tax=Daldinia loculata TaxID=103429 RepID=UPI0020C57A76|nr:HET-domain-containing protein [Daldinia loculata]KAI1646702.1 HET-domain-containing protein [Daldinia loculata]